MNADATLLIVDDEKQNRTLLTELLQDGQRVVLAKNGAQALELARAHLPDLILLDVLMPGMDGFATLRALKRDDATRDIPVIFITALDAPADADLGLELGASDYIAKPFHPAIVRARVRNHLQAVRQRRLLERLALIDGLTELPNRLRHRENLDQEWRRCLRGGAPLSLLVADIDGFAAYNDSHGHAAGDLVLLRLADAIRTLLKRPGDSVARHGGDEFAVLLPEVDATGARAVAEQIRAQVEELRIPHAASAAGPWITVSIGGATLTPSAPEVDAELPRRAEDRLRAAKQSGRNRVVWAPTAAEAG